MNAQEMLLDYAAKNNQRRTLTDQQFIGAAATDGVRLANNANGDTVIARVRREGKTIILTETVRTVTPEGVSETVSEIFRVNV